MDQPDAPLAESSPADLTAIPAESASDRAVASNDVSTYRAERAKERAGKPSDVVAESSPDKPVDQAASTEVTDPPASEPGKPRKNAESRVQELLAERARERSRAEAAERRLAELEAKQTPDVQPAAPSPAPAAFPSYDAYLTAHPEASYEDYLDARADSRAEARYKALKQEEAQTSQRITRTESIQKRDQQFAERIQTALKADPEFLTNVSDDVKALKPFDAIRDSKGRWTEQPTAKHAIAEELVSSPVAPQLMRHFTDHPEDLSRLATMHPRELLKEMGKLEARFTAPSGSRPAPKTVTDAPEPPTVLGRKPSASADPADAAVQADDVSAYRAARQAQRLAGLRR
jgi:DNA repair exonuclease SbcCD ATPase subunit